MEGANIDSSGDLRNPSRHAWKEFEEEALLRIVDCESSKDCACDGGRFRAGFINAVSVAFKTACPASNVGASQIRSKLAALKSNYRSICDVLRTCGFSWDTERSCVRADDGAWDRYVQNGGSARWQGKVYPTFLCLDRIFGRLTSSLQIKNDSATAGVNMAELGVPSISCSSAGVVGVGPLGCISSHYPSVTSCADENVDMQQPVSDIFSNEMLNPGNSSSVDMQQPVTESNCRQQRTVQHVWTDVEDNALLEALRGVLSKCKYVYTGHMKERIYEEVAEQLRLLCPSSGLQVSHIKRRISILKSDYETIDCLLRVPGFVWNHNSKSVEGNAIVWDKYVQVNKKAGKWRRKSCHLYDSMSRIFGQDCAVPSDGHCVLVGRNESADTVSSKRRLSFSNDSEKRLCVGSNEGVGSSDGVRVVNVLDVVPVYAVFARIISALNGRQDNLHRCTVGDLNGRQDDSCGSVLKRKRHEWLKNEEDAFLGILEHEASRGHHWHSGSFKGGVLATAASQLKFLCPDSDVTLNQIRRKMRSFRSAYDEIQSILTTAGFSWNENGNYVEATPDVWNAYVRDNKRAGKWRKKRFPFYNRLAVIFSGCGVHGGINGENCTCSCSSRFTHKSTPATRGLIAYRIDTLGKNRTVNRELPTKDQLCGDAFVSSTRDAESSHMQSTSMFGQHLFQSSRSEFLPNFADLSREYDDLGDKCYACRWCSALFWSDESVLQRHNDGSLIYTRCCREGKIVLPFCKPTPQYLDTLLNPAHGPISVAFRTDFRGYNCMFAFTSLGADIDKSLNNGTAPYVFRISGQVCHKMGSLLPVSKDKPKFAQLYVVDTDNEVQNRLDALSRNSDDNVGRLDPSIVHDLIAMLDANNELVQFFCTVRDKFVDGSIPSFSVRLLERRRFDSRQYDLPTCEEIGCLIPGDIGLADNNRDIIVHSENGPLQRISILHPKYMALQYPLLFPHGDDGYMKDLFQQLSPGNDRAKKKMISMRCFYAFQLQDRTDQNVTIQKGGRVFQQYLVDVYATVEENRLFYIRTHQADLRTEVYRGIYDAVSRGENNAANIGQKVILPSSFTGSARYMIANYHDAMAICRRFGNPDLFITFTCNAKWPEIERELQTKPGYKAEDRPDLVTRVFKMKFDKMMQYIKSGLPFGEVQADVSTIEFQKRGLPHAHMLFWLKSEYKCYSPEDLDSIISAEIPDKDVDPVLYDIVSQFMMHGPCGEVNRKSPCMVDNRCSKFFPKDFSPCTSIGSTISPTYRRRNDASKFVEKNGILLDNRHVVPYNSGLLLKFRAHINVESCSHSMLIKYLFKYITKGPDRSRVVFQEDLNNEVATYLNCRYIASHEAVWRLLEFPIHGRHPGIERLAIHLPLDNRITFHKNRSLRSISDNVMLKKTMLTEWFTTNQIHEDARSLTYIQFPSKFVWMGADRYWKPRDRNNGTIGRLAYVHPASGELYFMRMLLLQQKGCMSFEDIRTIDGILYSTYQEACKTMGMLGDGKEWDAALTEANNTATGTQMRNLFVAILLFCEVEDPCRLFERHWHNI